MSGYPMTLIPSDGQCINTYLPLELLREIFLYGIEASQMKSGHLASVCRYWRDVVTTMSHLWSTLRVGTQTEREQVTTWLQRAYPKKVVIDTRTDDPTAPNTLPFAILQDAFESTGQWHELTISSFPPEHWASQFGFDVASPTKVLKVLHVAVGCVNSPSFAHLLNLVPTDAPLSELRLHPSFATAHFLQPHWLPSLQNLTVLILNGRDIHDPFDLLPAFTRLHTFEADHLAFPWYGPDTNLPLLGTLQKLQLRASSVQWMAGREFSCLEECVILLPRDCDAVQLHEVQLPTCKTLTYHGYPMTTVQYFHLPEMKVMELRSHDCETRRVYQQLHQLCTVDGRISKLTTLHLTFQCSEQGLVKVLKYLVSLSELVLSIAHPSLSWKNLLESLVAKPSTIDWPELALGQVDQQQWEQRCSSQTWGVNVLTQLTYLGIQCPKRSSQSVCLYNCPLLRLVGWTRQQLTPPLEHLKVWEGGGTTEDVVVDYISTGYLDKHPDLSSGNYDSTIVIAMATRRLLIRDPTNPLFQLRSTFLFRQLHDLEIDYYRDHEVTILLCLEQIKRLEIWHGMIPAYSSTIDLPLVQTLQWLRLCHSTFSWMLGRTFKALREFWVEDLSDARELQSGHEALQVDLPACTTLQLGNLSENPLHFFSCPNVQILRWEQYPVRLAIDEAVLKSLRDFLCSLSCLRKLEFLVRQDLGLGSLIRFIFGDALEQGVWRHIESAEVKVSFTGPSSNDRDTFLNQTIGEKQHYEKWWKEFTVTMENSPRMVIVRASM
jgi:hypothetical protein